MIVTGLPQYPVLSNSKQSDNFAVLISLQAPRQIDHAPLDLIAILDVSDSMGGEKIRLAKQAIKFVVDNLGPSDQLSIITFVNSKQQLTQLSGMTDVRRVNTIQFKHTHDSTNIIAGLKTAAVILEKRSEMNPVSSIILLSDGQDRRYTDSLDALKTLPLYLRTNDSSISVSQTGAVPVHTFGLGHDHNATALHAIADGSGGTFSYIESIDTIQDAFAQCIGGLFSAKAQEVELKVRCVSPGVQIKCIFSSRYRSCINADGIHGVIHMVDLYSEEKRMFLVCVSVPPADQETSTTRLLEVNCSYKDPLSNLYITSDIICVEIPRPPAEDVSTKDMLREVDREIIRIGIAENISKAEAMAVRGELSEAVSFLEQDKTNLMQTASGEARDPFCEQLQKDLKAIQEKMKSRAEFEARGKAFMLSRCKTLFDQRASTQALIPDGASGSAPPDDIPYYQTSIMRRMVQRSQELRQLHDQNENSAESSSSNSKP
uniref:VWFA domain-containing protein n=2 Tax=Chenopodium quinoa TaxID=63459 RepID=A0A803KWM0_CHEQI